MILSNVGIIPWRNECGEENYPLQTNPFNINNVIQGAWFAQLDNFIPILKSISFADNTTTFICTLADGDVETAIASPYNVTATIYADNTYYGKVTFGDGLIALRSQYMGSTVVVNTPFQRQAVHSLNTNSGVFSIASCHGAVTINTTAKNHMYWQVNGNGVSFDCFSVPSCISHTPLLSINSVAASGITLQTNNIMGWTPETGGLLLSLASTSSIKPTT